MHWAEKRGNEFDQDCASRSQYCGQATGLSGPVRHLSTCRECFLDFAKTTTDITTTLASSATFLAVAARNARDQHFASAATSRAGTSPLAMTFRTQKESVRHCSYLTVESTSPRNNQQKKSGDLCRHTEWRPRRRRRRPRVYLADLFGVFVK